MAMRVGINIQQSQSIRVGLGSAAERTRARPKPEIQPKPDTRSKPGTEDRVSLSSDLEKIETEPGSKADLNRQILLRTFGIDGTKLGLPKTGDEDANYADDRSNGDDYPISYPKQPGESGPDGSSITTQQQIEIRIEQRIQISFVRPDEIEAPQDGEGEDQRQDPLTLDLNGNGRIDLTTRAQGIRFDINGDGREDQTAFATAGDAMLAMDRNGDGQITSGRELFGDAGGSRDGFADLAQLDSNQDGVIDRVDAQFEALRVFDGQRTRSLSEVGVASISLDARYGRTERADGNAEIARSTFTRTNGRQGRIADVLLAYRQLG